MKEYLKKDQLHLVKPKFRKMVEDAWGNGEEVPYGVVCLSDKELTTDELKQIHELNEIYKFDDEV